MQFRVSLHGIADFRATKISCRSTVNNDFKAWSVRPAGFVKVKHACSLVKPSFLNQSNSFPFWKKKTEEFKCRTKTQHATFCGRTSTTHCIITLFFVLYLQIKSDERNSPSLHSRNSCFLTLVKVIIPPKTTQVIYETSSLRLTSGCEGWLVHRLTHLFVVFLWSLFNETLFW